MNILEKIKKKLLISLPLKFKKRIICNLGEGSKHALVYFKTDPFFSKELRKSYIHTNNEEIVLIVQALNNEGYSVDLIDREASWIEIKNTCTREYDLYIGNAAGNSAEFHVHIMKQLRIKKKLLFAAGPEAYKSNELVKAQHDEFSRRNNVIPIVRRLVKGDHFEQRYQPLDGIISIGETFSAKSYEKWGKKIYPLLPTSSPSIIYDETIHLQKDSRKFLYFGGSGNICKGLDVVIEAFAGLEGVELDICSPDEEDFWSVYRPILKNNPHIRYHGFVPVGGDLFHQLTAKAAWTVFPASAEGCATSVVTCMRRGVIPVVSYEAGINLGDFGIEVPRVDPKALASKIQELCKMDQKELNIRSLKSLNESNRYTIDSFVKQFSKIIKSVSDS